MTKKRNSEKPQTKAGMLAKKGSQTENETENEKNRTKSKNESESTPKISKEEAEGQHDDKPIH